MAMMIAGVVIMGFGVVLFKASGMGTDPNNSLMIAIGDLIGVDFSIISILSMCLYFILQYKFGKEFIGIGTFANWFLVTPLASLYEALLVAHWDIPTDMGSRFGLMMGGVVILSFACALYQTADTGVCPYDALSLMLSKNKKWAYFPCRILTDSLSAGAAFCLGGVVGLGTLICAVGMGPFVQFFSKHVAMRLLTSHKPARRVHVAAR